MNAPHGFETWEDYIRGRTLARDVKIGDVVEFEPGSPVRVVAIELNWPGPFDDPSPHARRDWGRSLVFDCVFADDLEDTLPVRTFYVRRERSPISGRIIAR